MSVHKIQLDDADGLLSGAEVARLEDRMLAITARDLRRAPDPEHPIIGYVPGAWDMFHIGHLNLLRRARLKCDHLIVGVATDGALHRAKNKFPIIPLEERMQIVAAMSAVDEVVVDQGSKVEVHGRHGFDVLFKGDDWLGTPKGDKLVADMEAIGVRVEFMSYTKQISSTMLRKVVTAL